MKRQIFFCSVGGYDTHTNQTTTGNPSTGSHANLLGEVSKSMLAFQRAMEKLEQLQIIPPNSATAFTASDFGRTFPANGSGSDHGWGSHHLVCGGGVLGGKTAAQVVTARVAILTEGMVKAMFVAKLRTLTSVVLLLGVLAVGGLLTQHRAAGHPNDAATTAAEEKEGPAEGRKPIDRAEPAKADADNAVAEANENNNTNAHQIVIGHR